jgi:hypothetical protein
MGHSVVLERLLSQGLSRRQRLEPRRQEVAVSLKAALGTYQGFVGLRSLLRPCRVLTDGTEKSDDVGGVPVIEVHYRRPL